MSLSRAFTTRRAKGSVDLSDGSKAPHRSKTLHKPASQQPLRHKISGPVQLVHTTNMLSYNAPDIIPALPSRSSSLVAKISEDDSDGTASSVSTPPTSPESGPQLSLHEPEAKYLSSLFVAPKTSLPPPPPPVPPLPINAPAIPKRSPSHTKKNSMEALARKRSMSQISKDSEQSNPGLTFSRSSSTSTRTSSTSRSSASLAPRHTNSRISGSKTVYHPIQPAAPETTTVQRPMRPEEEEEEPVMPVMPAKKDTNPFGNELAQVTELVEEFGAKGRLEVIYEDEHYLKSHGLAKMSADDYLNEIHSLMATFWPQPPPPSRSEPLWI